MQVEKSLVDILKEEISIQEQNDIKRDLMVKPFAPPNSIQKPVEFPLYRESQKKIYVPRFQMHLKMKCSYYQQ